MPATTTSNRQSVVVSLMHFMLDGHIQPISRYNPRATCLTTFLLNFYFARGIVLYFLSQYSGSIRDFRIVLRMDWRHRGAAAWIAKAERAERGASGGSAGQR